MCLAWQKQTLESIMIKGVEREPTILLDIVTMKWSFCVSYNTLSQCSFSHCSAMQEDFVLQFHDNAGYFQR